VPDLANPAIEWESGAPKPLEPLIRRRSGGEWEGWVAVACLVAPEGEAVDRERVGQQVEVLAGVADRVGTAEPEGGTAA
jgi:hypothetical protein